MHKQLISKTLLMTGLVMLAANASATTRCAKNEVQQCTDLGLSSIAEKDRSGHCASYHEGFFVDYNYEYIKGSNTCSKSSAVCE